MDAARCKGCGGEILGIVCGYCGSLTAPAEGPDEEHGALDSLHAALLKSDPEGRTRLLQHGFLPDHPKILIEAGLRCIPLFNAHESKQSSPAAIRRLRAVVAKLRILPPDPSTSRAIEQFELEIRRYKSASAKDIALGFLIIGIIIALVVWGIKSIK